MKKVISILIILIGIGCLATGAYLTFTTDNSNDDTKKPSTNETKKEETDKGQTPDVPTTTDKIDVATIKDYSEYTNYKLNMLESTVINGTKIDATRDGSIDVKNRIINTTISTFGDNQNTYYDLNNGLEYYSNDNKTWNKNTNNGISLPDFTNVINIVKSQVNVTVQEDGQFSFTTTVNASGKTYENIPVTMSFTADGYIDTITYNLSNVEEGMDTYTVVYKITEVNTAGDVIIPNEIVTTATQGSKTTIVNYVS